MCAECDYGSQGVSRQSVNNHYKKAHQEQPEKEEIFEEAEPEIQPTIESDWMTVREDEEEGEIQFSSLPSPAKGALQFFSKNRDTPKSSAGLKAFYEKQGKMMTWFFRGVIDPIVQWYGKGVMGDKGKNFKIKRSKSDWELFEGIATEWVEYREVSIPVNPDVLMVGCVGSFYLPPLKQIHGNRDPLKPSLWGRLKLRLAKWRVKREMKRKGIESYE